jgi:type IV pilus assembly protein PilC
VKLVAPGQGRHGLPVGILVVAIGVTAVLLIFVIPVFEKMFADFGGAAPGAHAVRDRPLERFRATSSRSSWGSRCSSLFRPRFYGSDQGAKLFYDTVLLKAPVFGPLLRKVAVAKFTRTLGTMIASGVPILDALEIVAKSAGNKVVENAIMYTREQDLRGRTMAEPLAETGRLPVDGRADDRRRRATGAMDAMLQKIADFYEDEVEVPPSRR